MRKVVADGTVECLLAQCVDQFPATNDDHMVYCFLWIPPSSPAGWQVGQVKQATPYFRDVDCRGTHESSSLVCQYGYGMGGCAGAGKRAYLFGKACQVGG